MKRQVLGIDIGGTNLRGAIVTNDGTIAKKKDIPSEAKKGINKLIDNLANFIDQFEKNEPDAIGIGVAGIINKKTGILTQAPNIAKVNNFPIQKKLTQKLKSKIPLILENDSNSAAFGEYLLGAGREANSFVMLTLGTGLGGGIIINGEIWRGEDGMAGEIGHIIVNPDGPKCSCGNSGCLESYVSGEALKRMVKEDPELKKTLKDVPKDDIPQALMKLANDGDQKAITTWNQFGKWLGIGITSLTNLLNIDMAIIGGGISNAWHLFINETESEIQKRGLRGPIERLKVRKSILGDDAGILGVSYLAFKYLESNSTNQNLIL